MAAAGIAAVVIGVALWLGLPLVAAAAAVVATTSDAALCWVSCHDNISMILVI